jgi:hypothetical protein
MLAMEDIIGSPEDYHVSVFPDKTYFNLQPQRGITVIHLPTGTKVSCDSERSQHANRAKCLIEIKRILEQKAI